jgi:hypothetical protein
MLWAAPPASQRLTLRCSAVRVVQIDASVQPIHVGSELLPTIVPWVIHANVVGS